MEKQNSGTNTHLAETQFGSNFIYSCCFGVIYQFQAVLSGVLQHHRQNQITDNDQLYCVPAVRNYRNLICKKRAFHLRRLIDGGNLGSDAQRDVLVLGEPAVQVAHPLTAGLPPEVQEAVGNSVVLKHDVVHVSVFLGEQPKTGFQINAESSRDWKESVGSLTAAPVGSV